MKKSFLITILIFATLLSACQNPPATIYNSAEQSKQEKASAESKIVLTIGDQSGDKSALTPTPAAKDTGATVGGVAVK